MASSVARGERYPWRIPYLVTTSFHRTARSEERSASSRSAETSFFLFSTYAISVKSTGRPVSHDSNSSCFLASSRSDSSSFRSWTSSFVRMCVMVSDVVKVFTHYNESEVLVSIVRTDSFHFSKGVKSGFTSAMNAPSCVTQTTAYSSTFTEEYCSDIRNPRSYIASWRESFLKSSFLQFGVPSFLRMSCLIQ